MGPGCRVGVLHRCGAGARRGAPAPGRAGEGGLASAAWALRGHPSLLPAEPVLGAA